MQQILSQVQPSYLLGMGFLIPGILFKEEARMDFSEADASGPVGREPIHTRPSRRRRFFRDFGRLFWQGKIGPAFWTISSLISISVNIILIVVLISLGRQLFALKGLVSNGLVDGLYSNFVKMDQARITTTITVEETIPVVFDLPVETETMVVLTEDTRIRDATVNLATGGLTISNAPANIVLPEGTKLPIRLSITVPVNTTIPVRLQVPVDIPLNQTDLHEPFTGLQQVISPYRSYLYSLPNSWQETPACRPGWEWLCGLLIDHP